MMLPVLISPLAPPPLLQLLNSFIERACAAGNPAAAQAALGHMCRARLAPSAATFAPLLAALQRLHPAEDVAELVVGLAGQADEACGTPGHAMQVCGRAVRVGDQVAVL